MLIESELKSQIGMLNVVKNLKFLNLLLYQGEIGER